MGQLESRSDPDSDRRQVRQEFLSLLDTMLCYPIFTREKMSRKRTGTAGGFQIRSDNAGSLLPRINRLRITIGRMI